MTSNAHPATHTADGSTFGATATTNAQRGGKMAKQTNANATPAPVETVETVERTYRPEEIANALGVSGKLVRGYLRATFTRPVEAKGTTWVLTAAQAKQTVEHFKARRSPVEPVEQTDAPNA
jgi:hypothetical protein